MKVFLFSLLFFVTTIASAEPLFPLSSLRAQTDGNCWAYGATHMTEARVQARDGVSIAVDIDKSYMYWQIQDRLMNSFMTKKASEGLTDVGGFAGDYWYMMAQHGLEIFQVENNPTAPDYAYPTTAGYQISAKTSENGFTNLDVIKQLETELISSSMSVADAQQKIQQTVNQAFSFQEPLSPQTKWEKGTVQTSDVFKNIIGQETAYSPYDFVLVTSYFIKDHPELDGKWVKYDDDRLWGIGILDLHKMLSIARTSMDRGWPTTIETPDHVMTLVGYKAVGNNFSYAVSDSSGAYFSPGVSWQTEDAIVNVATDITVYYPIVKDLLPAIPVKTFRNIYSANNYPSIHIPRKK